MNHEMLMVPPGTKVSLKDYDTGFTGKYKGKSDVAETLAKDLVRLEECQGILYAQNEYSLLLVIQALDAAGKDSLIKHVMSGVNPQGVSVVSFKAPSPAELDHDFLWRHAVAMPQRGMIGIFNRSYYEEVLVVRVHPEYLTNEHLPKKLVDNNIWANRFEDINCFERYLTRNGIEIVKVFLHVSKEEQKDRFLERIDEPEKNWKFSADDLKERARWDDYTKAFEEMLTHTSTAWAPWYVIPADHKWFTRAAVSEILIDRLGRMDLAYPAMTAEHRKALEESRNELEQEGGKRHGDS